MDGAEIIFHGLGGVNPEQAAINRVNIANAAEDLKTRQLQNRIAQQQAARNAASNAIIAAGSAGQFAPPAPTVKSGSTPVPAGSASGTVRTSEGFLVRPDSVTATQPPGEGGLLPDESTPSVTSRVVIPPAAPSKAKPDVRAPGVEPENAVTMVSPDGDTADIPGDEVEFYLSKGYKRAAPVPNSAPVTISDAADPGARSAAGQEPTPPTAATQPVTVSQSASTPGGIPPYLRREAPPGIPPYLQRDAPPQQQAVPIFQAAAPAGFAARPVAQGDGPLYMAPGNAEGQSASPAATPGAPPVPPQQPVPIAQATNPAPPAAPLTPYQQLAKQAPPILKADPREWVTRTANALRNQGLVPEANAFEKQQYEQATLIAEAQLKQTKAANEATQVRHIALSDELAAFDGQHHTEAQRAAAWPGFIRRMVEDGNAKPDEVDDLQQYPGDTVMKQFQEQLRGVNDIRKATIDRQKSDLEAAQATQARATARHSDAQTQDLTGGDAKRKRTADTDKAVSEAAEKTRENDANALRSFARQGPAVLADAIAKLPEDRRAPFVGLKTEEEVMEAGLTNVQRVQEMDRRAREKGIEQQRRATNAFHEQTMEMQRARLHNETAAQAADRRQAQTEADKLQEKETALYPVIESYRAQLDNAVTGKKVFELNEKGEHPAFPSAASADAVPTMVRRHNALIDQQKGYITQKYNRIAPFGGKTPKPLAEMMAELDAGKYGYKDGKVVVPKGPAPATTPRQTSDKTATPATTPAATPADANALFEPPKTAPAAKAATPVEKAKPAKPDVPVHINFGTFKKTFPNQAAVDDFLAHAEKEGINLTHTKP